MNLWLQEGKCLDDGSSERWEDHKGGQWLSMFGCVPRGPGQGLHGAPSEGRLMTVENWQMCTPSKRAAIPRLLPIRQTQVQYCQKF